MVYAKSNTLNSSPSVTHFNDSIFVLVTSPGTTHTIRNRIITSGEMVQGTFGEVSDWPPLSGTVFTLNPLFRNNTFPTGCLQTGIGTFSGSSINNFEISPVSGGHLTGVSPTKLSGHYQVTVSGLVVLDVIDTGKFAFAGQTKTQNGFNSVNSTGSSIASLTIVRIPGTNQFTLGGEATFSGIMTTFSR